MRTFSRMSRVPLIAVAFGIGPLASAVQADPMYQVTNLGDISPYGLNSSGQVLAWYGGVSNNYNPFIYNSYGPNAGQQIPIPLAGATALNDNGTVSG